MSTIRYTRWVRRLAALATIALLLGLVPALSSAAPASRQAEARQHSIAFDLSAPHTAGKVLVKFRPAAISDAAYRAERAISEQHSPTTAANLNPASSLHALSQAANLRDLLTSVGAQDARLLWAGSGTYALQVGANADLAGVLQTLQANPAVEYAEPDYRYTLSGKVAAPLQGPAAAPNAAAVTPNDPIYGQQWYIQQTLVDQAWGITTGSDAVLVAVIDTGVSTDHPDLSGKIVGGYNFVDRNNNYTDRDGHGTLCAGIIGANGNNGTGTAGISWGVKILALKALTEQGGSSEDIADAIRYAADKGARVANLSLGGPQRSQAMGDAVQYADSKGMLVVAASGNDPSGKPSYPAGFDQALAVGATARGDTFTGFSSFGPYVDISSPGVGMWGPSVDSSGRNNYIAENGTSFSSPTVVGIAALMLSVNPGLTNKQMFTILENSADDIGTAGWDEHYGRGRVNALKAVQYAQDAGNHLAQGNVSLSETTTTAGSGLTVSGSGYAGGEDINLYFVYANGVRVSLADLKADAGGNFSQKVNLPDYIPLSPQPESYAVRAYGKGSGRDAYDHLNVIAGDPRNRDRQPTPVSGGPTPAPSSQRPTALDRVSDPSRSDSRFFAESGHTLSGDFRNYWEKNGGLALFGYPLSETFQEVNANDGATYLVQYFERNRFELHPENPPANRVLLGLLGVDSTKSRTFATIESGQQKAGYNYFAETKHSLGGAFLTYWQQSGGLAIYGYPISEEVEENGYIVQYFERNRFEYHPELPPQFKVSLGLLGVEQLKAKGWLQP